jgi:hypothetical protein
MLISRSTEESHLYMSLHPCGCGEADFEWQEHAMTLREGSFVSVYAGACGRCGRHRSFEFALAPEPSPPPPALGGDSPSQIIDPGEFLQTSEAFAATVPADPEQLGDDEFNGAQDALAFAAACLDEVLKFIPPGADAVPPTAFHTDAGRRTYQQSPERFTRTRVETTRDTLRRLLDTYAAAIPAS